MVVNKVSGYLNLGRVRIRLIERETCAVIIFSLILIFGETKYQSRLCPVSMPLSDAARFLVLFMGRARSKILKINSFKEGRP